MYRRAFQGEGAEGADLRWGPLGCLGFAEWGHCVGPHARGGGVPGAAKPWSDLQDPASRREGLVGFVPRKGFKRAGTPVALQGSAQRLPVEFFKISTTPHF